MSAIDDAPDYEEGSLIERIDEAFPCCTLCGDTARWENGMVCICMGAPDDTEPVTFFPGQIMYVPG